MTRMPGAVWDPLAANFADQPRMRAHDLVCIHTMVGSLEGTDSLFRHTNGAGYAGTESHYGTGFDGRIEQWQDNRFIAEANYLGSWHIVSIENADYGTGFPKWDIRDGSQVPAFTGAQVEANARILAWECSPAAHVDCPPTWTCHREGIPLALVPDSKPGRRGVAYHRQGVPGFMVAGGEQWSTARGKVCPGDRRIAQIPQIIDRARQIAGGATIQEDDVSAQEVWRDWGVQTPEMKDAKLPQASMEAIVAGTFARTELLRSSVAGMSAQLAGLTATVKLLAEAVASGRDDVTAAELEESSYRGTQRAIEEGLVRVEVVSRQQA